MHGKTVKFDSNVITLSNNWLYDKFINYLKPAIHQST